MLYILIMEYYSAIRMDEILPFVAAWMDLESIMLSKISQMERVKSHMISFMWDIKQKTTNKKINSQTDNSVVVTRRERQWEEG